MIFLRRYFTGLHTAWLHLHNIHNFSYIITVRGAQTTCQIRYMRAGGASGGLRLIPGAPATAIVNRELDVHAQSVNVTKHTGRPRSNARKHREFW